MSTFKRILLYAGMVISVIVLVLCAAGIIGAWVYNEPITETILEIVVPLTDALDIAEKVSGETGAVLQEVSTGLQEAQTQVEALGEDVNEANIAVEAVSTIVGEDIQPKLDEAGEKVRSIHDTLGAFQEAIQAFNDIPFIDLELPGADELDQLRSGMVAVVDRTGELSTTLQERKTEIVEGAVEQVNEPLNQLETMLTESLASLAEIQETLGSTVESLLYVQENVGFWIDLVSIVITLVLAWLILSQVALFVLCRKYVQGKVAP